jgi:RNA polymerase sigma-70 factor (ECF subfamily)
MEDVDIVKQIIDRQEQGLSNLYDKYAASLNGIIIRIVRDNELSEEILSNTMLKAWNKIDSYDAEKSGLFTWLAAIARNSAIDKARLKSFKNNQKTDTISDHVYKIGFSTSQAKLDVERLTSLIENVSRRILTTSDFG